MLDLCLLGTGGMMPLPYRWLTSLMLRYNGSSLLIDCGEGTQISIREKDGASGRWTSYALRIFMEIISAVCREYCWLWGIQTVRNLC